MDLERRHVLGGIFALAGYSFLTEDNSISGFFAVPDDPEADEFDGTLLVLASEFVRPMNDRFYESVEIEAGGTLVFTDDDRLYMEGAT